MMALIAVLPALVVIAYTQTLSYHSARERAIEDALHLGRLAASQQGFIIDEARLRSLARGRSDTRGFVRRR